MPNSIAVAVLTHDQGDHLGQYFSGLAETEECGEVTLADASGKWRELARKSLGNKLKNTYPDAATLLRQEKPALALVTMEAAKAPPVLKAALDAGCHILSEKPACVRIEDFEPLVRQAEQTHRHFMLALANRSHTLVPEARRFVQEGKIGKLYGVEIHVLADQTRLKRESYRNDWLCDRARSGGGHLIWLGIHWLDLVLHITGQQVEQVAGFTTNIGGQPIKIEDSAAITLRFQSGVLGTLTSGYYLDSGKDMHVQIWGDQGWLRMENLGDGYFTWYNNREPKAGIQRHVVPNSPRGGGYMPFVRYAVRAAAGLQPAPISPAECLHVLRTIFACYRAAQTGQVQKV